MTARSGRVTDGVARKTTKSVKAVEKARRYSDEERHQIVQAYLAWNPTVEDQLQLAERLNTTKTTMMKFVKQAGVPTKRGGVHLRPVEIAAGYGEPQADLAVIGAIARRMVQVEAERDQYANRLRYLEGKIREAGYDPDKC
ncbi:MAG TPA: hypothetical protein VJQ57_09470 [Acidimicrobiia bacterium]|nr:hypothetical protein [Acidimicrobiia bacterium]